MSNVEVFSTVGGYHPLTFEYHGGYHDTCGGYHEYRGVFSTVGYSNNKRFSPHGTEHLTVLMIFHHMHHDIPPWY